MTSPSLPLSLSPSPSLPPSSRTLSLPPVDRNGHHVALLVCAATRIKEPLFSSSRLKQVRQVGGLEGGGNKPAASRAHGLERERRGTTSRIVAAAPRRGSNTAGERTGLIAREFLTSSVLGVRVTLLVNHPLVERRRNVGVFGGHKIDIDWWANLRRMRGPSLPCQRSCGHLWGP